MKNKKLIFGLVFVVGVLLVIGIGIYSFAFNKKEEKINVYLFWGNGCPHCEYAKEFFSNIQDEYGSTIT